jgi:succinylglutamate desuccinylase
MLHSSGTSIVTDYDQSRNLFRAMAAQFGASLETIVVPSKSESDLRVDLAYFEPIRSATNLIVISSGVHGVEAPLGAEIQRNLIEDLAVEAYPRNDTGYLIIHAVNPFGFRHKRRVTESNVDLNRNCVTSLEHFSIKNPGYERLDAILNPAKAYEGSVAEFIKTLIKLLGHSKTMGYQAIVHAIAAGQYQYERGIMYGGEQHEPQIKSLRNIVSSVAQAYAKVLILDIHTGLGPRGKMQLLSNHSSNHPQSEILTEIFGKNRVIHTDAKNYYANTGDFSCFLASELSAHGSTVVPIVAEFGTLDTQDWLGSAATISRLITENQIWWHGSKSKEHERAAKHRFDELFCPSDPEWQRSTVHMARSDFSTFVNRFSS